MPGLGGLNPRPVNAPPGGGGYPGVQPGVTGGVVVARYVIISGTGGGWFIYNGTPGPGNPPVAWGTSGTTDPYGNVLPNDAELGLQGMGTFQAGDTIISDAGEFLYSGTPAAGNLLVSDAQAAGTDPYGNAYLAGSTVYEGANAVNVTGSGRIRWYTASTQAGPWSLYTSSAVTQADSTQYTVTGTTLAQITKAWDIPANDANAGTVYTVSAAGTGGTGATSEQLEFQGSFLGTTVGAVFDITGFPASQVFSWTADVQAQVTATGTSGTAVVALRATVSANGGITSTSTFSAVQVAVNTPDTTTAGTIGINAAWVTASTGETVTCHGSVTNRDGP